MTHDLATLYAATGTAKIGDLLANKTRVKGLVPPGADVTLTGQAPVWLYLRIAHLLHGRAKRLYYESLFTGPVEITLYLIARFSRKVP